MLILSSFYRTPKLLLLLLQILLLLILVTSSSSFPSLSSSVNEKENGNMITINDVINSYKEGRKNRLTRPLEEEEGNNINERFTVKMEFNDTYGFHRLCKITITKNNNKSSDDGSVTSGSESGGEGYHLILPLYNEIYIDEYDTKLKCSKCSTLPKLIVYDDDPSSNDYDDNNNNNNNNKHEERGEKKVLINVESPSFDKDVISNGEILTILTFAPSLEWKENDDIVIYIMYHVRYLSPINNNNDTSNYSEDLIRESKEVDKIESDDDDVKKSCVSKSKSKTTNNNNNNNYNNNQVGNVNIPAITLCRTSTSPNNNDNSNKYNCNTHSNQVKLTTNIPLGNMKHYQLVKITLAISITISLVLMSLGINRL